MAVQTNPETGMAGSSSGAAAKRVPSGTDQEKRTPIKEVKKARMVGWYDPGQLARTGIEVVVSTLFGRHSDFRLLEALTIQSDEGPGFYDHTYHYSRGPDEKFLVLDESRPREAEKEFWIDYVSDVGDGWNPTYTLAYYLGKPELSVSAKNGEQFTTKQGSILIFGGDGVYPTASRQVYEQRLVVPYDAGFKSEDEPPHVYAVPGNHDWYDSLVAFTRLFCQKRWFAGWQTQQTRSYFALKLPRGWWLLGTDVQLGSDIDKGQVDYFKNISSEMKEGDRVILCNAEPHWVYSGIYKDYDPSIYNESNLKFLDDLLRNRVRVYLAGDLHHYRRHQDAEGNQKITAGGGGAFLHPTHAPAASKLKDGYTLQESFPDQKTSSRLCWGNLKFGLTNKQFGLLTGLFYFLTLWAIDPHIGQTANFGLAVKTTLRAALAGPVQASWVLAIFVGFLLFTDTHSKPYRIIAGSLHGLTHLFMAFLIGWFALYLAELKFEPGTVRRLGVFGLVMFVGGYITGPLIMGLYLLISLNGFERHSNEAFSSLKNEDYKHFLRMKIDASGDLSIFPIGIRKVPRDWIDNPAPGRPYYVPASSSGTAPELIEKEPIRVKKEAKKP